MKHCRRHNTKGHLTDQWDDGTMGRRTPMLAPLSYHARVLTLARMHRACVARVLRVYCACVDACASCVAFVSRVVAIMCTNSSGVVRVQGYNMYRGEIKESTSRLPALAKNTLLSFCLQQLYCLFFVSVFILFWGVLPWCTIGL